MTRSPTDTPAFSAGPSGASICIKNPLVVFCNVNLSNLAMKCLNYSNVSFVDVNYAKQSLCVLIDRKSKSVIFFQNFNSHLSGTSASCLLLDTLDVQRNHVARFFDKLNNCFMLILLDVMVIYLKNKVFF